MALILAASEVQASLHEYYPRVPGPDADVTPSSVALSPLRSWLERQQNCPTCRGSVFQPRRDPAIAAAAAAAAAALAAAGPEQAAAVPPAAILPAGAAAVPPGPAQVSQRLQG